MNTTALSRRQFSVMGLGALAGLSFGRLAPARQDQAPAAPPATRHQFFDWKVIGRTARVAYGQGGNALAVAKEGQAVLIDCKNSGLGATLRREAAAVGWPIMLVINTHHHGDHVGGNPAFRRDMKIVAHKNAIERCAAQAERMVKGAEALARALESGKGAGENGDKAPPERAVAEAREFASSIASLKPEDFTPTQGLDAPVTSFAFSGLELHLLHAGPGHTDNDLFIHMPALNILHTGDLVFHKLHPFIDAPAGATTRGWQNSCREMLKLCNDRTTVVPGHGEVGTAAAIQMQIDYFDRLRGIVRHAKDVESMTREEVMKLQTGAFEGYGFEQMLPRALGAVYDELVAEKGGGK